MEIKLDSLFTAISAIAAAYTVYQSGRIFNEQAAQNRRMALFNRRLQEIQDIESELLMFAKNEISSALTPRNFILYLNNIQGSLARREFLFQEDNYNLNRMLESVRESREFALKSAERLGSNSDSKLDDQTDFAVLYSAHVHFTFMMSELAHLRNHVVRF